MTLFFIRYTSIPQSHVFRIDCVAVIANTLSLRFSTKYLIALGCFIGLCKEKPLMTS